MLIAEVAIFFEGLVDDAFEFGGEIGIHARGGGGRAIENFALDDSGAFAAEGQRAGSHLVEDGAAGKEIGAGV